jgi:urease accessory protein
MDAGASFAAGLLHPLGTPAHLVALVGLGVASGRAQLRAAIVAAFALGLVVGLGAIAWGVGETPASDVLLSAAAVCGALAAVVPRLAAWLAAPLAPIIGVALGLDSPPEVTSLGTAVLMLLGTACGGAITLAILAVAASLLAGRWHGIVLRIAGSWVAAIAILVLALRWAE